MSSRKNNRKKINVRFDRRLVLFQWFMDMFEVKDFYTLSESMRDPRFEGFDEEGRSNFYYNLRSLIGRIKLTDEQLLEYDENIVRHWKQITLKRNRNAGQVLYPKYFQYLSLLFTEIYLDRYFTDDKLLLQEFNDFREQFNLDLPEESKVKSFVESEINKLAFWCATGGGKTLLMHINLLQYEHYTRKHSKHTKLNKIILLTPNEGLSHQHLAEFRESDISAELFVGEGPGLFAGKSIEIIDIHKLKEQKGQKTFAIESFEGNNLIFVDEGHRGMAGGEKSDWLEKRDKLCEGGFSFEYSATFGQALRNDEALQQRYAKCIIFDYSYKWFYGDGYGKQYRIFNLPDDHDDELRTRYLTAGLLAFFQQYKLFNDNQQEYKPYRIAKPLWVFVGNSVNAVRTEKKRPVSDVVDILLFLSGFVTNKEMSLEILDGFLTGHSGLTDSKGGDLYGNAFPYLVKKKYNKQTLYADILQTLFNATSPAGLHVVEMKGIDGEIALRIGDNIHFGVISVGDTSNLIKLCEKQESLITASQGFSDSLFKGINKEDSTISLLIGSRKFSEGWNSWRVASMGLMNIGRTEGAQIIQLFGRGVRLKGLDYSLKRTTAILGHAAPSNIQQLETLQIFGVRADYMSQFKAYLEEEGLPADQTVEEIVLPVISNLGKQKLKTIKLPDGLDFKRNGPKPTLRLPHGNEKIPKITVDLYPGLQVLQAKGMRNNEEVTKTEGCLTKAHLAFIDINFIYFQLQQMKNERSWFNLNISKSDIISILTDDNWYQLLVREEDLLLENITFRKIKRWQEIAVILLKKYVDRYYKYKKAEWEKDHYEYQILGPDDPNFIREYQLLIDKSQEAIIERLREIKEEMEAGNFQDIEFSGLKIFQFDRHLYKPLFHIKNSMIKIKPVALNESEKQFVEDLKKYYEKNIEEFSNGKELYLLRNLSRGKGVGFFEAGNFYPDFIMWIVDDRKQYINFIDPHGLRHEDGKNSPKIQFHKTIKEIEIRLGDADVTLNSYIVSPTRYENVAWWSDGMTKCEFDNYHVYFQEDKTTYIQKILES